MDSFTILFGHFIKLSLKYENNLNLSCACAPLPLMPAASSVVAALGRNWSHFLTLLRFH
jgi:hypothetical protein